MALAKQQSSNPVRRGLPETKEARIESMHSGFQTALDDLSMTRLRTVTGVDNLGKPVTYKVAPIFGVRRVPTIPVLHNGVLRDSDVPMTFGTDTWKVDYYAVSNSGKPLSQRHMHFHTGFGSFAGAHPEQLSKEVVEFADKALPAFSKGNVFPGKINGLEAQARPLRLSKAECLSCHKASKIGDPMAIIVYVVAKPDNSRSFGNRG